MSNKLSLPDRFAEALSALEHLPDIAGSPKTFWEGCLSVFANVTEARLAVLLCEGPKESPGWKKAMTWPADLLVEGRTESFVRVAGDLAEAAVQHGAVCRSVQGGDFATGDFLLAVRLAMDQQPEAWVAAFHIEGVSPQTAEEGLRRLRLLSHLPAIHRLRQQATRSETAVSHFASVLDLMTQVNAHQRFMAAAMAFCNELAARHHCDRVSLGWLDHEYVGLRAMSHSERFEKKMEAVKTLEAAMEEALDQDEIIVWPEPEAQRLVTRDHGRLAEAHRVAFVCSLPLRVEGEPVAVLTCERDKYAFNEVEIRLLALCGEMAMRRLADLKRSDRWFGARWATAARERLTWLAGPEHTGAKLIGLLATVALLVLVFGHWNYRVEAPFSLRTKDAGFVSAPFDGFIEEVKVELGDRVEKGAVLANLDTRELLLQEAEAVAVHIKYLREAEKARGAEKIAEMRIAEAQAEQARAKLELLRFHRDQAALLAPFVGAVVEGDLRKRIGAPVKQGDVMFKIARTDRLHIECEVNERDVEDVREGGRGVIAFASLPKLTFPIRIRNVELAAQAKENANVYLARCDFEEPIQPWMRPGMSGVAKLEVGERSLLWVVTHRTMDFLRMYLWW
jgi:multidrug resistance efflux pump